MHLRSRRILIAASVFALMSSATAYADPVEGFELVVNGEMTLVTEAPASANLEGALDTVYSGLLFRGSETREMEMDDFSNPGMVFVDQGLDLWNKVDGTDGKSCASCHDDVESLKETRAAMPKMNPTGDDLWSMENYINNCRTTKMGAEAWKWSSDQMTSVTAAISVAGRGEVVNPKVDGAAAEWWEKGKELYYTRFGQLELSCANCHEQNYGNMIRADHLSQGQTNGFPAYRLKNAKLNSVHNRFKGCVRDTRAETFGEGSAEFRALELYVASRGAGLSVEGVGVRN